MKPTIRKRFDDESGLWHIEIYSYARSQWTEVATHNEEAEADDCIADLSEWKAGR